MGTVEHRQAIPITGHGLAVNQARRSLERERGARDQGEAALNNDGRSLTGFAKWVGP
jgi:hypothetical protein